LIENWIFLETGDFSKFGIAYCSFEDLYFEKIEIFPKV